MNTEEEKIAATEASSLVETDKEMLTPNKENSVKRKSLVGLSPAQNAKVATLKQMFQDKDQEELCAILFDENDGNLDSSIEFILTMQQIHNDEDKDKEDGTKEDHTPVDKKTQELIDEMLAEEQQAMYQDELEEARVKADLERQRKLEQLMIEREIQN